MCGELITPTEAIRNSVVYGILPYIPDTVYGYLPYILDKMYGLLPYKRVKRLPDQRIGRHRLKPGDWRGTLNSLDRC